MIQLNVVNLLKKQNKSKYWLYNAINNVRPISYTNFNAMLTNKTKSIKYENIELLCNLLQCEPNDLFTKSDTL